AGVVDERVDAAERRDAGVDDRLRAVFRRRVGDDRDRAAAGLDDERDGFVYERVGSCGADDLRALVRERLAHHPSDAFARAGDDRGAPLEQSHSVPPSGVGPMGPWAWRARSAWPPPPPGR